MKHDTKPMRRRARRLHEAARFIPRTRTNTTLPRPPPRRPCAWAQDGTGKPDLTKSLYIQAPISIMGFSLSVTPEDVTTAELNFSLSGQPSHLFV